MANGEHDDIMGQVYIAFGQGVGTMRVSRRACAALRKRYYPLIAKAAPSWDADGAQALERIQAIGRRMANEATAKGRTTVTEEGFEESARAVELESATWMCNPPPTGG